MTETEQEELVASLADDFLSRLRAGEAVTPDTFAAEHPECAAELLELLPAMMDVEGLSQCTRPNAGLVLDFPEYLGGYHLLKRIGSGGMGTVFRAVQESLRREVAIKILAPSWNADARHSEAFENESRVIARLRHTNIVEVYGAGQEGSYRYYVMGLVNGTGVTAARMRAVCRGMPPEQAVARVGVQAAAALAYAHGQGVLHRDIKPGNLMLDDDGVLHVGDFGLATVLNSGEQAPLVTQSHDGTLRYMAPERLTRGENSFAGDQYALGLTLYELLTNRPAFQETEPGSLIHRICSEPITPLRNEGELGAIINKSISFDPADRYRSMDDMHADLQRFLNGEPVVARPASFLRRYAMWFRRRPAVALWSHAAALLVVLLLVSVSLGYARVRKAYRSESEQRVLAERNADIADAALQRIFTGMVGDAAHGLSDQPTKADARLLEDLMPYYEEIVAQAEEGDARMGDACRILAGIAYSTRDYATATEYFRRAAEHFEKGSVERMRVLNGLAASMLHQQDKPSLRREAYKLLHAEVDGIADNAPFELRLEKVRALMTLSSRNTQFAANARGRGAHAPHGGVPQIAAERLAAAKLLHDLLREQPANERLRMLQVEMLQRSGAREISRLLLTDGQSMRQLIDGWLKDDPENDAYRQAYVQALLRPQGFLPGRDAVTLEEWARGVKYMRSILAENPGDSDLLIRFINVSDRYAAALTRQDKAEEARRVNEQTLGVLSLVTSRDDFTQEQRERLAMLVSMHPAQDADRSQQETEISLLLQSSDEKRMQELRINMQRMRQNRQRMRRLGHPAPQAAPRKPHGNSKPAPPPTDNPSPAR